MDSKLNPTAYGLSNLELFVVENFFPETGLCDLLPAGLNQRGQLSGVPVCVPFAGSWEAKSSNQPSLGSFADQNAFGNAPRGGRWGMTFPVEPGDMALVAYLEGSQSDPIVIAFVNWRTGFAVPWLANQVLSKPGDYTEQLPEDDDELTGRFDLLLPTGAWLRSTRAGSWVMATSPVDRPKAFLSLHADGKIKVKSRAGEDYCIHVDFDPATETGRVVVGKLEDGSYIEFKDGNITIRAQKQLRIVGEQVRGDLRPQGGGSALDVLTSSPSAAIASSSLPGLVTAAAGQQLLQGVSSVLPPPGTIPITTTPIPSPPHVVLRKSGLKSSIFSSFLADSSIDGALRGRIGDILTNPGSLLGGALDALKGGLVNDLSIGDRLTSVLGANLLGGNIGEIVSRLDITALPMIKELGLPSWVGKGIQAAILGGNPVGIALQLLPEMTDSEVLDRVFQAVGGIALNGDVATVARAGLDALLGDLPIDFRGEMTERVKEGLLPLIDEIPVLTPKRDGGVDWLPTAAQRLGRHILRGSNFLGGGAILFDGAQIAGLGLDLPDLGKVNRVIGQIEDFAANPHSLIENLPDALVPFMPQIAAIPPEIRGAIAQLPQNLLPRLPGLASGLFGSLSSIMDEQAGGEDGCAVQDAVQDLLTSFVPAWEDAELGLGALLQSAPGEIRDLIGNLPEELLSGLGNVLPGQFRAILENPASFLGGLDGGMISNCFGGATGTGVGTFNMRVSRQASFSLMPQGVDGLPVGGRSKFHQQTTDQPIERTSGYGELRGFVQSLNRRGV